MNAAAHWTRLEPSFKDPSQSSPLFTEYARSLAPLTDAKEEEYSGRAMETSRERYLACSNTWPKEERQMLTAAGLVLTDLALQRWGIRVSEEGIFVRPPTEIEADFMAEKERVRRQELLKRDEQLAQPAVREFIRSMEKRRLHREAFVSIFSLMRDGRSLAKTLRDLKSLLADKALAKLEEALDPYLQFVSEEARCEHTGFLLQDIWRYFRHTWSNQYTSVPGRGMMFLVRDRAAPLHPVVGIGSLASPIIQIRERDVWIGWNPSTLLEDLRAHPTEPCARWLQELVDRSIDELYREDFLEDGLLSFETIRHPDEKSIEKLLEEGEQQRKQHHRFVDPKELKSPQRSNTPEREDPWEKKARSHLFRSKRAVALAELLRARSLLRSYFGEKPSSEKLAALLNSPGALPVLLKLLKKAKADRVGISMADISVCGAIPPYNAILGGKLVSMLSVSPEVVEAYRCRYQDTPSEIASSMAGRPIVRPPHLVFLGTTSLYGIGSSQYNRVSIPCDILGGLKGEAIRYQRLGKSEAFGTSHYGRATVEALVNLTRQSNGGQRVNSIFGEGVSPKLRKVRGGLEKLGFPSDFLLRHGRRRIVYGVTLVRNTRDYLLSIDADPDYLVPIRNTKEATKQITRWWKKRWLLPRIQSEAVLAEVERHTLVYPVQHGARVVLPETEPEQPFLFGDM